MFSTTSDNPYLLYIEDDPEDVELLSFALTEKNIPLQVVHAYDGVQALNMLNELKYYSSLPSLIVLDVNMPKMNGKETFVCLKADIDIARIPILVLSTSNDKGDISYFRRYNTPYIIKPGDGERFVDELDKEIRQLLTLKKDHRSFDAA